MRSNEMSWFAKHLESNVVKNKNKVKNKHLAMFWWNMDHNRQLNPQWCFLSWDPVLPLDNPYSCFPISRTHLPAHVNVKLRLVKSFQPVSLFHYMVTSGKFSCKCMFSFTLICPFFILQLQLAVSCSLLPSHNHNYTSMTLSYKSEINQWEIRKYFHLSHSLRFNTPDKNICIWHVYLLICTNKLLPVGCKNGFY